MPGRVVRDLRARPTADNTDVSPAPDTFANKESMAQPTHRAQSASDGLGHIASPAPLPLPVHRTRLGPTPMQSQPESTLKNLHYLTESGISAPRGDRNRRANPIPSQNRPRHVSKRFKTSHATSENHQTSPNHRTRATWGQSTPAQARRRADFPSAPPSLVVRITLPPSR